MGPPSQDSTKASMRPYLRGAGLGSALQVHNGFSFEPLQLDGDLLEDRDQTWLGSGPSQTQEGQDQRGLGVGADRNPGIRLFFWLRLSLPHLLGGSGPSLGVCHDAQALRGPCRLGNTCRAFLSNRPQAFPGTTGKLRTESRSPASASHVGEGITVYTHLLASAFPMCHLGSFIKAEREVPS